MRVCSCVLAGTEACKHCNNNYERSLERSRRIKKRDA